jgi:acylphosphatase
MSVIARRCRVFGRVQGVFFRASTRKLAEELSLTGYARNLPDGTVEVLAIGAEEAVDTLCAWLEQGPPLAVVREVRYEAVDAEELERRPGSFTTR